jgi:hypothetical protein
MFRLFVKPSSGGNACTLIKIALANASHASVCFSYTKYKKERTELIVHLAVDLVLMEKCNSGSLLQAGENVVLENNAHMDSFSREPNSNPAIQEISKSLLYFNITPSFLFCLKFTYELYLASFQWNGFTIIFYRYAPSFIILYSCSF